MRAGDARGHQTKDTFSIVPTTMYQQVADHRSGVPIRSMALQCGKGRGRAFRVVNMRVWERGLVLHARLASARARDSV